MVFNWESRTELEKALILMLCASIPMVLLLIGAQIYFSYYKPSGKIFVKDYSNFTEYETTTTQTRKHSYEDDSNSHAINPSSNINKIDDSLSSKRFYRNNPLSNLTKTINVGSSPNLYFNISARNKRNSMVRTSSCDCFTIDECYNLFEPHKFISSISDPIYEDDPIGYKYKCASVLLTDSYILSSINCLTNGTLTMRVSSEYWSKDGYVRQISSIKRLNNSISIGQLSKPLINDRFSIKFIQFSNPADLKNIKQVDTYRWNSKYTQFKDRKKYNKLYKIQLNVTECSDKSFNGFCSLETGPNSDLEQRDMVFKIETNKLLGIEVERIIRGDQTEHFYTFVKEDEIEKLIIDKSYLLVTYISNMQAI